MFAFMLLMAAAASVQPVTVISPPRPHRFGYRQIVRVPSAATPQARPVLDPLAPCTVDPASSACSASATAQYDGTQGPRPASTFDPKTHAMQIYDPDRTCSLIGSRCLPSAIKVLSVGLNAPD